MFENDLGDETIWTGSIISMMYIENSNNGKLGKLSEDYDIALY